MLLKLSPLNSHTFLNIAWNCTFYVFVKVLFCVYYDYGMCTKTPDLLTFETKMEQNSLMCIFTIIGAIKLENIKLLNTLHSYFSAFCLSCQLWLFWSELFAGCSESSVLFYVKVLLLNYECFGGLLCMVYFYGVAVWRLFKCQGHLSCSSSAPCLLCGEKEQCRPILHFMTHCVKGVPRQAGGSLDGSSS